MKEDFFTYDFASLIYYLDEVGIINKIESNTIIDNYNKGEIIDFKFLNKEKRIKAVDTFFENNNRILKYHNFQMC